MVKMTPKRTEDDATAGKAYDVTAGEFEGYVSFIDDDGDRREWSDDRFIPIQEEADTYTIILETLAGDEIVAQARLLAEALKDA